MAPYTMTIELKNDSGRYVAFVGPSTMSGLDGTTDTVTDGDVQTVKVSKSGGTDGLFTALSFVAANGSDSSKNGPFTVWAMMPAKSGGTVSVQLVDATAIIHGDMNQLRVRQWADRIYNEPTWVVPKFHRDGWNFSLEKLGSGYPDSYYKLHVAHS